MYKFFIFKINLISLKKIVKIVWILNLRWIDDKFKNKLNLQSKNVLNNSNNFNIAK